MATEGYTVKGVIQVADGEHRELWLEPVDGSHRLIVHPKSYDAAALVDWLKEQRVVVVRGQLLPSMRIVRDATVELDGAS